MRLRKRKEERKRMTYIRIKERGLQPKKWPFKVLLTRFFPWQIIASLLCCYRYLEKEHLQYCYSGATGMAKLPLNAVYVNGVRDPSRPTTGTLPNGDAINATDSYKMILSFFTSSSITPEELKDKGYNKLDALLIEVERSLFEISRIVLV